MPLFSVTYEIFTPDSAEAGDAEERGFVAQGVTLREATRLASPSEDCGRWWSGAWNTDYRTGAEEARSIHPPRNITPASYARVSRVLSCNR